MYKAVIFDLDGTLLNTIQDLADAGNVALKALGLPTHTVQEYMGYVGNGIPKLIERMVPQPAEASVVKKAAALFDEYYSAHKEDTTAPYPGMETLLDELSAKGLRLAVLSNKQHNLTVPIVRHYFGDRFTVVQGLEDDMPPKPDPTGVNRILAHLGLLGEKQAVLYVGDSDTDMRTAAAAGLKSCGVLWGFRPRAVLEAGGAAYLCADTDELKKVILQ